MRHITNNNFLKNCICSYSLNIFVRAFAARWVINIKSKKVKMLLDGILTLPLVLPPTVVGFILLIIFGGKQAYWKIPATIFRGKNSFFLDSYCDSCCSNFISPYVSLCKKCL